MTNLTLVLMAAGMGSRYGGLKQIEPVGPHGEWILDYSIYDALRAGFDRVILVVRKEIEREFRARFDRALGTACRIDYAIQRLDDLPAGFSPPPGRVKPWGTGHAVWSCRDLLEGPLAVINADDFYGRGAFEMLAEFLETTRSRSGDHALVGYELPNTLSDLGPVTRGVCRVDSDGFLSGIVERHRVQERDGRILSSEDGATWIELPASATASMNTWGFGADFTAEVVRRFPTFLAENADRLETAEFFLPEVVHTLIETGQARVRVLATDATWFGITFREDAARAREKMRGLIESGIYPDRLWSL